MFCILIFYCFVPHHNSINPNRIVIYLTVFFTLVFGLAIYIEWRVFDPMLGYFTLFFGVFIGFYSVKDIYDGTCCAVSLGTDRTFNTANGVLGLLSPSVYFVFVMMRLLISKQTDLIIRTAEGSDAVACNKLIPCCLPKCVGVQFWICAFGFQVLGLYMALVWMVSSD